ncbi:2'-5' RNA ligase family protein [Pedobacter agri]|uniref:2'-5' RNA ligase family protein n=1 Tax=Pedobacter agri TaxID=454586 RepID=UPI00292F0176|nr:2'-5' RNA ligase family protein [Pedobacter agri]
MENLYLVCLIPPKDIVEELDEMRNFISAKFNVHESLKRPAHITLYDPVKLTLSQEERFFSALNDAAYSESFEQILFNFKSFPEHTFYVDAEQNKGIMNLKQEIDQKLKPMELLENNRLKFNPHVTLAFRDVKPEVCRQIIAAFKDRTFKRKFIVSGFSVYKHNGKRWQPFKEILFKMPAEKPKALTLFG